MKVSIVGFGNIGKAVYEALSQTEDMELVSIVSSKSSIDNVKIVKDVSELNDIDVAILCGPSREVPGLAEKLLKKGICTVDSYDIHDSIADVCLKLDAIAKENGVKSIMSAGWDPGSDSVVRALSEVLMPKGITDTNFGPGMSMGHSVAVKSFDGVVDALSVTIPVGTGIHRRMVYVETEDGVDFASLSKAIKEDSYFVHDETHVIHVESVDALKDIGHGVNLVRKGVSGITGNQRLEFNMSINNPALTGQILVSSARAVLKQDPGCYTMIEIPLIDFLKGEREFLIRRLV